MVELESMELVQTFRNQTGCAVFRGMVPQGAVLGLSHDVICKINGVKWTLVEVIPLAHEDTFESLVIVKPREVIDG